MVKKKPGKNSSVWDTLNNQDAKDSIQYRDVYENQQIERGEIGEVKDAKSIIIGSSILTVVIFILSWVVLSIVHLGVTEFTKFTSSPDYPTYVVERDTGGLFGEPCVVDSDGVTVLECFESKQEAEANVPAWAVDQIAVADKAHAEEIASLPSGFVGHLLAFNFVKFLIALLVAAGLGGLVFTVFRKKLDARNLMHDTTDINQYKNDQHIATPDEVMRKFDWFPDAGAHSSVQVSSMISHVMLENKGLKKVDVGQRYKEDQVENGEVLALKGELIKDEKGNTVTKELSLIDEDFGEALFDASGAPTKKQSKKGSDIYRKRYDATKVEYNADGSNREKLGKYATVADMINDDWSLPDYEPQRPAGAYLVDTAPVNTMVLAITRAGKGQTYIEPVIDMWLREKKPSNMVINDPKGELLVKNYVRATTRGFKVVQFNLINAMKTDIYNPLGMAAEAAREGDTVKTAMYVENIADVFFPVDGGDDPVWPNAANNAFKRAAYGLIDYYLEEERELRAYAARTNMNPKVLETKIDNMWGR